MIRVTGYKLKITFRDSRILVVENTIDNVDVVNNYVTNIDIDNNMYTTSKNPIGVLTAGSILVNLNSLDKSLIPDNSNSEYFGYMDNTAMLDVYAYSEDVDGNYVFLGHYFVSNWDSAAVSDNTKAVSISGTDIIGILMKNNIPDYEIKLNTNVVDILTDIETRLNNILEERYRFRFNIPDNIKYNSIDNNDIEANNMSEYLNTICQSTLLNMFTSLIENENVINVVDVTDTLASGSSIDKEITREAWDGNIIEYSGVKVNYYVYNINAVNKIGSIMLSIGIGDSEIDEIGVNGTIYKVTSVQIDTNDKTGNIDITSVKYNRRGVKIGVSNNTDNAIDGEISIEGQTLNSNSLSVIKRNTVGSNELLEVTNKLINVNKVSSYSTDLLDIMNKRSGELTLTGFFNPVNIKLNSIVEFNSSILDKNGKYRVCGVHWTLNSILKADIRLVKG